MTVSNVTVTEPTGRPDWAMVGIPGSAHVSIYASKTLTEARIVGLLGQEGGYRILAQMADVQIAVGRDYGEALRALMESWSPDADGRPALPAAAENPRPISPFREGAKRW